MPLTHARLTRFLSSTDYFGEVDLISLSAIVGRFEVVSISRGENLFDEGGVAEAWYVIVEGGIDLFGSTPSGEPMFLTSLGEGDGFGEIALLENVVRTATATPPSSNRFSPREIETTSKRPTIAERLIRSTSPK